MADGKELRPKSFRIDDETAEKFKEISGKIGGSQQETLAKLIEAFEFQSGKAVLTEKKADIEKFEKYVTAITRMFMGSLEDNQNLTEIVRTEFDALLKSKDATIQDLQEKLTAAKQLKEDAVMQARAHADESARLNGVIDSLNSQMDNMQSRLADKENLNKALTDSCNDLKYKVDSTREAAEQAAALQSELEQVKKKLADLEKQLQQEQAAHADALSELKQHEADALEHLKEQMQLEHDRSMLQAEKSFHAQLQQLKAENQTEIDKYQKKYFDLLEQMQNQDKHS